MVPSLLDCGRVKKRGETELHTDRNATDIGIMMGPYYELAMTLGIEAGCIDTHGLHNLQQAAGAEV
eukprot:2812214-Amphidinium_carterae.1